jgi:hypothetical protein
MEDQPMITMAELDDARNASTAAKEALREALTNGVRVPSIFDDRARRALEANALCVLRNRVEDTEAAADRAVLRWIAQGCQEEETSP